MKKFDILVIGFGKAGKTIVTKLAKEGKKVALIEENPNMYGGTCINVGCIPSKRLVTQSQSSPSDIDAKLKHFEKSVENKNLLIEALREINYNKVVQTGAEVLVGRASFVDKNHIEISNGEDKYIVEGEKIIINTGSRPVVPNIDGIENNPYIHYSEDILSLETLPKSLTIVGGGYIGLEFAFMFANFGSKVTLIQNNAVFLPREDEDIAHSILNTMNTKNIEVITKASINKIEGETVYYSLDNKEEFIKSEAILLATGRKPNTEYLALEKAGIKLDEKGIIITDQHLRTSVDNIWAAGDVCGKLQFTYISLDDSRIILSDMYGDGERTTDNRGAFSYSVFLDPPFSRVGLSEKEAKEKGLEYSVLSLPANAIPMAKVMDKTDGLLKALVDKEGYILGAHLFCAQSHEVINFLKLAIDNKIKYQAVRDFIFTHPTISESLNDLFAM